MRHDVPASLRIAEGWPVRRACGQLVRSVGRLMDYALPTLIRSPSGDRAESRAAAPPEPTTSRPTELSQCSTRPMTTRRTLPLMVDLTASMTLPLSFDGFDVFSIRNSTTISTR